MEQIRKEYSHEDKELIEAFMKARTVIPKLESPTKELKEKSQCGKYIMINYLFLSVTIAVESSHYLLHTTPVLTTEF